MTRHRIALRALAVSTVMAALPLTPALAQDANAVAERMKALLANQGMELSYSGASGDASEMVISGVTIAAPGEKQKAELGDVTLRDVTEANGGYTVGSVTLPDYSRTQDGMTASASGIEMTGMRLPAEGAAEPLGGLLMYDTADIANIDVKVGDKQAFSMTKLHFEASPPSAGSPMEFSGSADSFTGDLSLIEDPKSREAIEALGYTTISGNFEVGGSWDPSDGQLELDHYDITVDDAGTFGMTFDIGGYTTEFIKSLQELQKKMAEQPEGADKSSQGMAMLGLMQQLTFNSASIRFDDDSLTNKALEYAAGQQGKKPEDLKNQAKAILPFLLAQLNNPEFTTQATQAVTAYLDDPQSIEIDAEPENPVPFALIMAGAMSSPQELIKTLAVSVTANED